jgi:RNA polymerase sigma factor (sigma-70 family)
MAHFIGGLEDGSVLQRARRGDRSAFEDLLRPLIEPAYRLAFAMLHEREAAEDAVQNMALKGWRHRARIRPELETARPWFLAILANECRMARRERWWSVLRIAEPVPATAVERDLAARMDLVQALDGLPYKDRLLLHLYFVLDLPLEEVAQVLGIGVGATKSRLHRVTRRLRPDLETMEALNES